MNSLVLDESHHGPEPCPEPEAIPPTQVGEEKENVLAPPEAEQTTETVSVVGSKGVLTRMMRLAQRYLLDPMGRKRTEGARPSQTQAKPRQRSPAPGRVFRNRTSSSLTQAQIRTHMRSQQRGGAPKPAGHRTAGDVAVTDAAGRSDGPEPALKRTCTGPSGKAACRHSNRSLGQPHTGDKSLRLLRSKKNPPSQTSPPSSSVLPPSLRSSTLPPSSSSVALSQSPPSSSSGEQRDTPRTAHQGIVVPPSDQRPVPERQRVCADLTPRRGTSKVIRLVS